jgi:hypothetical protein
METNLQAKLSGAIRTLQGLVGESATINGITYPCIVGIESVHNPLDMGGFQSVAHATISIALCDILKSPVAPAIGNTVLLVQRSRTYRIDTISPTQTTWELELQDVTA